MYHQCNGRVHILHILKRKQPYISFKPRSKFSAPFFSLPNMSSPQKTGGRGEDRYCTPHLGEFKSGGQLLVRKVKIVPQCFASWSCWWPAKMSQRNKKQPPSSRLYVHLLNVGKSCGSIFCETQRKCQLNQLATVSIVCAQRLGKSSRETCHVL